MIPIMPLTIIPFLRLTPTPFTFPVPWKAPIIGVIPDAKPNSVNMKKFITLFTNEDAASSFTLCHPIIILSANARIITQA